MFLDKLCIKQTCRCHPVLNILNDNILLIKFSCVFLNFHCFKTMLLSEKCEHVLILQLPWKWKILVYYSKNFFLLYITVEENFIICTTSIFNLCFLLFLVINYRLFYFFNQVMVMKALFLDQIFEMEILIDLHVLRSPESESHIFSDWFVRLLSAKLKNT